MQATFPFTTVKGIVGGMFDRRHAWLFALAGLLGACSEGNERGSNTTANAGGPASGGSLTGGVPEGGNRPAAGGRGTIGGGGSAISGAASGGGGTSANGGTKALGGTSASAGSATTSGSGSTSRGGASTNGGAKSTAGAPTNGGTGAGGVAGTSGAVGSGTKRGIAANVAPGAAFYPAVRWWYNWAIRGTGADVGIEFVPMIWNQATVNATIPSGSSYLLGFNEPNFFAQANLSAAQAASYWPAIENNVSVAGRSIVGPGMNYCGPAAQCHGTDPYQYLKDFFAACTNCKVDYVAVHWYNCDLPSLRDYLEPGGNLPGFEQFGKPIWITEFSCDETASVAQQEAYMRVAIPYLESNPKVFRYSWFSAGPIPNAKLVNDDGTPTALGRVYTSLPHN